MSSAPPQALIITGSDIRRLMTPADFLAAVERGFRAAAMGKAHSPHPMHIPTARGSFHAKGASISLGRDYVAVKVNGNFPGNPARHGLPTIQGAIILADGSNGSLLAILDSIEVTLRRTAAASALAAKLLARPDSRTLLICGGGKQGRAHLSAIGEVLPIEQRLIWDRDRVCAERLAAAVGGIVVDDLEWAAKSADVIATCTTATAPFLHPGMIGPSTFIAAVGADNPDKNEISPDLMAAATVVTDVTAQCSTMGDLHHALEAGSMTKSDVRAELAEVLAGTKPGRCSQQDIIIFDSTGTGLQDVAASAAIYERCIGEGTVGSVPLAAP